MTLAVTLSSSGHSRHFLYVGAMAGNLPFKGRWRCRMLMMMTSQTKELLVIHYFTEYLKIYI